MPTPPQLASLVALLVAADPVDDPLEFERIAHTPASVLALTVLATDGGPVVASLDVERGTGDRLRIRDAHTLEILAEHAPESDRRLRRLASGTHDGQPVVAVGSFHSEGRSRHRPGRPRWSVDLVASDGKRVLRRAPATDAPPVERLFALAAWRDADGKGGWLSGEVPAGGEPRLVPWRDGPETEPWSLELDQGPIVCVADDVTTDGVDELAVILCERGARHSRLDLLDTAHGTTLWSVPAPATPDATHVVRLADLDGDGHDDLAVAWTDAPSEDGFAAGLGSLTVHSGADGATLWSVRGTERAEALGICVTALPDVDGDGVGDVLCGALSGDTEWGREEGDLPDFRPILRVLSGRTGDERARLAIDGGGCIVAGLSAAVVDVSDDTVTLAVGTWAWAAANKGPGTTPGLATYRLTRAAPSDER